MRRKRPSPVATGGGGWRYRVTVLTVPGGKTALPLPFAAAPRPTPLFNVVRIETGAAPRGRLLEQDSEGSGKRRPEPAFGLCDRDSPARGVVLELVPGDPADREVLRLRVVEIEAADRRGGRHREGLGQRHAG